MLKGKQENIAFYLKRSNAGQWLMIVLLLHGGAPPLYQQGVAGITGRKMKIGKLLSIP